MASRWITILSEGLLSVLGPLSLIVVGYLVEKKYVGRISIFTNTLALNLHTFALSNPPAWLVLYSNIGLIFGILGLLTYWAKQSLPKEYYYLAYVYSSIPVGLLIFSTGAL